MLSRRQFLKRSGMTTAGLGIMGFPALHCGKSVPDTSKMNILHIVVEDWSSFAVGCYGNDIVKTPNIDALAKKGVQFNRTYCQSPVCNPSRSSFVTGLRPDKTTVYGNDNHPDEVIPEYAPSLARLVKRKNVFAGQFGKLMHKWEDSTRFSDGFDYIEYMLPYDYPGDQFKGEARPTPAGPNGPQNPELEFELLADRDVAERLMRLRDEREAQKAAGAEDNWDLRKPFQQLHAEQTGDSGLNEEDMKDGRIVRSASKLISKLAKESTQFFVSVGLYATHTPLLAPKKYVDMYPVDEMPLTPAPRSKDQGIPSVAIRHGKNYDIFNGMYPEYGPTEKRQKEAIASYYACASYIDAQIGILLDTLEKEGLARNTIVYFFSDHGFHLGEHGCWSKFTLFEQSIRVPMVVYVPGLKSNGTQCDEIVELVDFVPTICDLWGLNKSEHFDGKSLWPLIQNPSLPWKEVAYTLLPRPIWGRTVRTKRYRYGEYRKGNQISDENPVIANELYDLQKDPYEQINIVDKPENTEIVRTMKDWIRKGM